MGANVSIQILLASCFPRAQTSCSSIALQNCQGFFETMDALNLPLAFQSTQGKIQGHYHSLETAQGLALATSPLSVPPTPACTQHSSPHPHQPSCCSSMALSRSLPPGLCAHCPLCLLGPRQPLPHFISIPSPPTASPESGPFCPPTWNLGGQSHSPASSPFMMCITPTL